MYGSGMSDISVKKCGTKLVDPGIQLHSSIFNDVHRRLVAVNRGCSGWSAIIEFNKRKLYEQVVIDSRFTRHCNASICCCGHNSALCHFDCQARNLHCRPECQTGDSGVSAAKSTYLPSLYCATFFAMGSSGTFQGSRASSFSRLSASPICAST